MTTQPVMPHRLMTVAEYLEIGEVEPGYTELAEGRLVLSPSTVWRHNRASSKLWRTFEACLPPDLTSTTDIDVDLRLAPVDAPGTVRRPDVVVVRQQAVERVDREGGILRASDLVLAVEVVSPGSRRLDRVLKRSEYADAGIPHYWIVDLDEPVSLVACHLAEEFGYVDGGEVTGVFRTTEPFPFEIDLNDLY